MNKVKRTINLVIVITLIICCFAEFEKKEAKAASYTEAHLLSMSGEWSQDYYITKTNDEHWYKIVVPSDGKVQIKLMHYMSHITTALYNVDFSNNIVNGSYIKGTETTPETDIIDYELSSGMYYLKITGDDGRYKLNTTYYSYQATDSKAQSYNNPQSFFVGNQVVGALTYTDKEDWFKISIGKDSRYVFKLTHYMYRLSYELYNADLSLKVSTGSYIKGNEIAPEVDLSEIVLSKGVYYLRITGDRGKYLLSLNQLNQSNCTHDYDGQYYDATYFTKGYRKYVCSKCGHSYKTDYSKIKKLNRGYLYSFCSTGKGSLILSWSTEADASGYQIRYCRKKAMTKGVKIKTIKGKSKSKKTIKKLPRGKRYYVQIRAYKKSGAKVVYGKWSAKKVLKTK